MKLWTAMVMSGLLASAAFATPVKNDKGRIIGYDDRPTAAMPPTTPPRMTETPHGLTGAPTPMPAAQAPAAAGSTHQPLYNEKGRRL
jgi:hypothetical protein